MFVAHLESGDRTTTLMMTLTRPMRANSLLSNREGTLMKRQTPALNVSLSITIILSLIISHLLEQLSSLF